MIEGTIALEVIMGSRTDPTVIAFVVLGLSSLACCTWKGMRSGY